MKKIMLPLLVLICVFIACQNDTQKCDSDSSNAMDITFYKDLQKFHSQIDYISFSFESETNTCMCMINDTQIITNIADIEVLTDVIKIPYMAKKGEYKTNGIVYKKIISDSSGILLSFDDYYEAWNDVLSIFKENEVLATWFVRGSSVNDFMKNATSEGHCIGYHTKNHTMLKYLSEETYPDDYLDRFDWECVHFLPVFREAGIPMKSFAIPHGSGLYYDWQIERLYKKGKYQIVRDFDPFFHLYSDEDIRSGYISSQSIDNNKFSTDEDFKKKMAERLLITKLTQRIYPCTSHPFSDDLSAGGGV